MNFMAWNCRGTTAKGFSGLLKDLRREYSASLMFLLQTHSSGPNCLKQVKKTGFSGQFVLRPEVTLEAFGVCGRFLSGRWRY